MVRPAVIKFKEPKALRSKSSISPKEVTTDRGNKLKNKFRIKVISKYNGIKNEAN